MNTTSFPHEHDQSKSTVITPLFYTISQLCLPKEHFYNGCVVLLNVSSRSRLTSFKCFLRGTKTRMFLAKVRLVFLPLCARV